MGLISSILFALSANLDTLIVGLSYGIKKERIPFLENVIISLITVAGTVFSIYMGLKITLFIPADMTKLFGCAILIILGLYYVAKFIVEYLQGQISEEQYHLDEGENLQKTITLKESVIIACALSVNNMGMGVGASISGIELIPTSISTLLFCMLFLYAGNKVGSAGLSGVMKKWTGPVSGAILMVLGLYEILI